LLEKQIIAAEKSRKIVFVRKHKEFEQKIEFENDKIVSLQETNKTLME
jgi:hypothetical protein